MGLFRDRQRPDAEGLRLAPALAVARETFGAALVHADPPWTYRNTGLNGSAKSAYECASIADIARDLNAAYDTAREDAYLLLWITWPILAEALDKGDRGSLFFGLSWRVISGGSWHKTAGIGIGFHWRGDSEPLLLLGKGTPKPVVKNGRNAYQGARAKHSEKPEPYLRDLLGALTAPGDLVLDLYAGMAPMRRAALATGRRYVGAEVDPERRAEALARP